MADVPDGRGALIRVLRVGVDGRADWLIADPRPRLGYYDW